VEPRGLEPVFHRYLSRSGQLGMDKTRVTPEDLEAAFNATEQATLMVTMLIFALPQELEGWPRVRCDEVIAADGLVRLVPRVRLHDLRHTAATLLLAQGVPPRVLMEVLGHSQIGVTMNIYSHVMPSQLAQAANALESAVGRGAVSMATRLATLWDPDDEGRSPDSANALVIRGGAEGTRTPDPHTASVVRYQLRHGPRIARVARALAQ